MSRIELCKTPVGFLARLLGVSTLIMSPLLIACNSDPVPQHWIHGAQVAAEYRDEAKVLRLAPGWSWPTELNYPDKDEDGNNQLYEVNTGRVEAAWYWHCSWARTFLSETNPTQRKAALMNVLEIRESAFYRWGSDDVERRRNDQMLSDVKTGNTEFFEQTIKLNCPVSSK
ncbi:hypothetical protein [Micromonospora sp. HUAS LYJ1]|uniref:hypothetical protein n=1 Tax=Micromonospora sp. HUAS LYJ1 TaxID=3061626 RepID=UPI002672E0EF|nr:hypothetical protein [Micromonospora sp. HUAS LYJ1]WKU07264.1 hypothetical protein Q2K16_09560 [Micromonospora sp. HUAS LYJ1]